MTERRCVTGYLSTASLACDPRSVPFAPLGPPSDRCNTWALARQPFTAATLILL